MKLITRQLVLRLGRLIAAAVSPSALAMAEPFEAESRRIGRILSGVPRLGRGWIVLVAVICAVGVPTLAGLAKKPAPPIGTRPPASRTFRYPLEKARNVRLQPGTYSLDWKNLGSRSPERVFGFAGLRSAYAPKFRGLGSPQAQWAETERFIAVLDESLGEGLGYDTLYLLRAASHRASPSAVLDVRRGIKVRMAPPKEKMPPGNRQHPRVVFLEGPYNTSWPMLVPVNPRYVAVTVEMGPPGARIVRKTVVRIGVYSRIHLLKKGERPNSMPGAVSLDLQDGWLGTVKTSGGPRRVTMVDVDGNGIFGESSRDSMGKEVRYADEVRLEMPGLWADHVKCAEPVAYGGEVYRFDVSPDGSKLTIRRLGKVQPTAASNSPDDRLTKMVRDGKFTKDEHVEAAVILRARKYYVIAVHWRSTMYPTSLGYTRYYPVSMQSLGRISHQISPDETPVVELWAEPDADTASESRRLASSAISTIYEDIAEGRDRFAELGKWDAGHVLRSDNHLRFSPNAGAERGKTAVPTIRVTISEASLSENMDPLFPTLVLPRQKLQVTVALMTGSDQSAGFAADVIKRRIAPLVENERRLGGTPIEFGWRFPTFDGRKAEMAGPDLAAGAARTNVTKESIERQAWEARMQDSADAKAVVESFLHAVQKQDGSAVKALLCADFHVSHGERLNVSLLRYDPHSGITWQSIIAFPGTRVTSVSVYGARAEATVMAAGEDHNAQAFSVTFELVKEGTWKMLSVSPTPDIRSP